MRIEVEDKELKIHYCLSLSNNNNDCFDLGWMTIIFVAKFLCKKYTELTIIALIGYYVFVFKVQMKDCLSKLPSLHSVIQC